MEELLREEIYLESCWEHEQQLRSAGEERSKPGTQVRISAGIQTGGGLCPFS